VTFRKPADEQSSCHLFKKHVCLWKFGRIELYKIIALKLNLYLFPTNRQL